ncbi:MAG: hypothetical protein JO182_27615 [Acidobacteriaceae bacterium]|nr:hypothetical protein [Acidobacteriaceae bacterium]
MNIRRAWFILSTLTVYAGLTQTMSAQQLSVSSESSPIKQVIDDYMQPFPAQHNAPGAIVGVVLHSQREFFRYALRCKPL